MEFEISPSPEGKYILIRIKGSINRHNAMQINLKAYELGRKLKINRYLVDATQAKNTDDPIDAYEFAYVDMQTTAGIDPYARVAAIVSPDDHSHDFMETVIRNAGSDFKIFTRPDDAENYLLNDLPEH